MGKRSRGEDDDGEDERPQRRRNSGEGEGGGGGREERSIGQRTSHIKNKQRRSELYDKLRHKASVRVPRARGRAFKRGLCAGRRAAWVRPRRLMRAPPDAHSGGQEEGARQAPG